MPNIEHQQKRYGGCKANRNERTSIAKHNSIGSATPRVKLFDVWTLKELKCWKCHACHVKCSGVNPTQFVAELPRTSMKVLKAPRLPRKSSLRCWKCHACHVKCSGINPTQFVAELPRTSMKVLKAPRLPRKSSLWGAESVTPATSNAAASIRPSSSPSFCGHLWRSWQHHACHANRAWGADSVTPAT